MGKYLKSIKPKLEAASLKQLHIEFEYLQECIISVCSHQESSIFQLHFSENERKLSPQSSLKYIIKHKGAVNINLAKMYAECALFHLQS